MMKNTEKKTKLRLRKGDTVKVIAGNSKGKTGEILEIIAAKNRAVVEGVNIVTKHVKPSATNPEGGIEKTEASIHISNLMLVNAATGEPTRVGKKVNDEGKLQRYAKKTGEYL